MATTSPTIMASIPDTARSATSSSLPTAASSAACASSSISSSTTLPMRIPGFSRHEARRTRRIATGTSGPTRSPPMPAKAWCFPACKNPHGAAISRPAPGTSIASTTSSPISTPRTRSVQAEILKIMGFWIQLGVSGFRMDAVPFVIATKGAKVRNPSRTIRHAALVPGVPAMARRATPSSSPKPMSCPTPTWSISAKTATACT